MRAEAELSYVVERIPEPNPVFHLLCETAGMTNREAYSTFNMGIGYAFYVAAKDQERALTLLKARGHAASVAGYIEKGPKRVVLKPVGVEFDAHSLAIR
jgi:phosphoribosylformylglycinamidine cyclo-ligase